MLRHQTRPFTLDNVVCTHAAPPSCTKYLRVTRIRQDSLVFGCYAKFHSHRCCNTQLCHCSFLPSLRIRKWGRPVHLMQPDFTLVNDYCLSACSYCKLSCMYKRYRSLNGAEVSGNPLCYVVHRHIRPEDAFDYGQDQVLRQDHGCPSNLKRRMATR
jgi:hypothetical protein